MPNLDKNESCQQLPKPNNHQRKVSFFEMLRYSDGLDKVLMLLGVLLAGAQGVGIPLALYFLFTKIMNAMISYSPCFDRPRKMLNVIVAAQQNGTFANLPLEALAFMNTSEYQQIRYYQSLRNAGDYSLFREVGPICGWYALVGVGLFISGTLYVICWTIAGQRQIERISKTLFRAMLAKDASWFDERRSGALNNVLFENIRKMEEGITAKIPITLSWISLAVTGFVMAFAADWLVTIVVFTLVPALFLTGAMMMRLIRKYSALQSEAYGTAGAIASEVISNARTVIAFNRQEYEVGRYGSNLTESKQMALRKTVLSGAAQGVAQLTVNAIAGLAFWWGNDPHVQQAGGNLMQILICVILATTSLATAAPNFEAIAAAIAGADAVYSIIDEASQIDNFSEDGRHLDSITGEIVFENVGFAYPGRPDRRIFKSLNLEIHNGQTVALVGPSGSGKSTAAQMLLRFYDATSGKVSLDGVNVRDLNIRWLRQSIGLVSQEPVLFNTTIKENIRLGGLGRGNISDNDIIEAAKLANAHTFISALPDGYDTKAGERGAQLSGGQKQRIAIARALVSNPKILLLDEATSALDTESEKVVQEALDKARVGRTTLIIAHRLSTIRNADMIVAIEGGVVVEQGTHDALMSKGGLYYRLVKNQEVEGEESAAKKKKLAKEESPAGALEKIDETAAVKEKGDGRVQKVNRPLSKQGDLEKGPSSEKMPSRFKLMATVLSWGRPELPLTILCGVVSALNAVGYPAFAIVMSQFLSSFCPGDTQDTFKMLIGLIIAIGAFQAIMLTLQHFLFSKIGEGLTERIRCRLLGKILRMDAAWLDRPDHQPSILTTILATDCIDIQGLSGVRISLTLTIAVVVLIAVIYSLILEYRVALALIGLMPFIIISNIMSAKMLTGAQQKAEDLANHNKAIIAMDAISNIRTVMALTAEPYFLGRFGAELAVNAKGAIKGGSATGPLLSFVLASVLWSAAITFCLGSWLMENEGVHFTNVIRVFALITFSGMAIGRSSSVVPDQDKAKAAAWKLMKIFAEKPLIDKDNDDFESIAAKELASDKELAAKTGSGRIEFKDVSFSYPNRPGVPILKGVSFSVEPGQRVALCGPSGGGKSTIMQLVQRLYDPANGTIAIDGVDIRQTNIRALRSTIGLVAQEPVLFALSIAENISYGSKTPNQLPTVAEIEEVCKQANANEFLSRLPEGLKTSVGERGAQLSGGQKQRIAIARALVRNPSILLLDEATSALDTESERIVQEAIDVAAKGRTSLAIAHRLSTIQNYDKILVLANGQVAEEGTHLQLMAKQGIYYGLQLAQNSKRQSDKL